MITSAQVLTLVHVVRMLRAHTLPHLQPVQPALPNAFQTQVLL